MSVPANYVRKAAELGRTAQLQARPDSMPVGIPAQIYRATATIADPDNPPPAGTVDAALVDEQGGFLQLIRSARTWTSGIISTGDKLIIIAVAGHAPFVVTSGGGGTGRLDDILKWGVNTD